jgi:hypothetical protein
MKWFKHDSDASNDAKLKKLRLKYGAQGYGIYWYCLELVARNVEKHNLTFELEHDAELIADDFKLSADLVQHIMTYMVELELFENTDGIISCLKMATRADEYTQQILRDSKRYALSQATPDSVPRMSEVIEEKRTEKKRVNKTTIPKDFVISDRVISWANQNGYRDLKRHFDNFVLSAQSKGYTYIDWDSALMKAIRDNWAGVNPLKIGHPSL